MVNADYQPTSYTKAPQPGQPQPTGFTPNQPVAPLAPGVTASSGPGIGGPAASGPNLGGPAAGGMNSNDGGSDLPPTPPTKQPKKIFGLEARSLAAVLGLALFFVVAMGGVLIALRQRQQETVAPTAPESRPEAVDENVCTVGFTVVDYERDATCTKIAFENDDTSGPVNFDLIPDMEVNEVEPGDEISYAISVSNTGDTPISVTITDVIDTDVFEFVSTSCQGDGYDADTNTLSCQIDNLQIANKTQTSTPITYTVKVLTTIDETTKATNTATIKLDGETIASCSETITIEVEPEPSPSPSPSPTPKVTPTPTPTPKVTPTPTPTPKVTPTPVVKTSPSPTPLAKCNEACTDNADCANSSHICYQGKCRLDSNVSSTVCAAPVGEQPELPEELPESGSEDIINWLKAGFGVLGIGAILLLLL